MLTLKAAKLTPFPKVIFSKEATEVSKPNFRSQAAMFLKSLTLTGTMAVLSAEVVIPMEQTGAFPALPPVTPVVSSKKMPSILLSIVPRGKTWINHIQK